MATHAESMSTLEAILNRCRALYTVVQQSLSPLSDVETYLRAGLADTPDGEQIAVCYGELATSVHAAQQAVILFGRQAHTLLERLRHAQPPPPGTVVRTTATTVRSQTNDVYPAEAAFATDRMSVPYSPPGSTAVPVRGIARAGGREHQFSPSRSSPWTERVNQRLVELGAPDAVINAGVSHHVEMQAVAWMIASDQRSAEIVINRTPCGYRRDLERHRTGPGGRPSDGCHQILSGFIPTGCQLHVYGTDDNGHKAFIATYIGRAKR